MNDLKIEVNYIDYKNNPWGCIQTYGYDDITYHNTGSDASADNEWSYMNRMQPNGHPTVHYFVDDVKAIKCMPLSVDAWAVSDGATKGGNTTDIHIEICYSKSGGPKYEKALKNAIKLGALLCSDLKWKPEDRIKFHYDYGTKYCPHRTLNDFGGDGYINSTESNKAASKLRKDIINKINNYLNNNKEDRKMKPIYHYDFATIYELEKEPVFGDKNVAIFTESVGLWEMGPNGKLKKRDDLKRFEAGDIQNCTREFNYTHPSDGSKYMYYSFLSNSTPKRYFFRVHKRED